MIGRSELMRDLRELIDELETSRHIWAVDVCKRAFREIEFLTVIIVNDPVELPIEEGDRANG